MAKYFRLQTVAMIIFVLGFVSLAATFAWKQLSQREAEAQSPCCSCGQCSSPSPSPVTSPSPQPSEPPAPSPVPSVMPSPIPTPPPASPTPASPTPGSPTPVSYGTHLSATSVTCEKRDFDALMTIKDNDKQVQNVKVKFTYGNQTREVTTDSNGWARANFGYTADIGVEADPEGAYQTQSVEIRAPRPEECAGVGGSSSSGEVLGSSTMAPTGVASDLALNTFGNLGGILTVAGSLLYARKRKISFQR